jgi:purine-cytosine permease-like protein
MPLPASRIARILLGLTLIIGGIFAILPVLGLWMVPLGLVILSVDFAIVRRWRRRAELWWAKRKAEKAKK